MKNKLCCFTPNLKVKKTDFNIYLIKTKFTGEFFKKKQACIGGEIPSTKYVGKYISLEAKIAKDKDLYYDALNKSQYGWYEGSEDVVPFIKYILSTNLAAYKDLRIGSLS